MIEAMFDAQAFQSSGGVNGHKTMIALCAHPPRGRLSQGSIGLERFMKTSPLSTVSDRSFRWFRHHNEDHCKR